MGSSIQCNQLLYHLMGKSSKRSHPLDTTEDQRDIDDDSALCGSDLSSNVHKMVKFEDNCHLLKTLMNVSNETMLTHPPQPLNKRLNTYSSRSRNGKYELKIVSQPEEQHRPNLKTQKLSNNGHKPSADVYKKCIFCQSNYRFLKWCFLPRGSSVSEL
ncbi:unnamed protein product [Medioppia subpectinata]|uniref:Uncharacterized protein n=1 Tax=Medioppia subpectinata TaxID=1979941 RepID=A0A7R9PTC6_9ACAR|nr:unnamed protein product [Medioppia subpectinata]CAG2099994.1 unnamed protein product [Medioppia subpectinata]